jgi:ATP-dependent helicase/nuclease subunit A
VPPKTSQQRRPAWYYGCDAEDDTQASGGDENAIQLVTHHGAKGLEWPIVIATDLDAKLKPRLWGLSVLRSPDPLALDDPLAGRTLRYWPKFTGMQSSDIRLLDHIEGSDVGLDAMKQEVAESQRLLYVSLTRPRDGLIIATNSKNTTGPWMDTLDADWMIPNGETHALPDGTDIPSRILDLEVSEHEFELPHYDPAWLVSSTPKSKTLPLRLSPSSFEPLEAAKIGEVIELGDRLKINGEYDPIKLGSALHAVAATAFLGQGDTERVLEYYGMLSTISPNIADESIRRLREVVDTKFSPTSYSVEYPIKYTLETGQVVSGWIDLLLETADGLVLIDHKASPRTKSSWEEIALSYSGQLKAYSEGITKITNKPVIGSWIHFAVTGGLVEVI